VRTRVGYAGGTTANPSYYDLGDHSEAIQIDYDPERISYEQLLEVFWESHNPTLRSWSRQYASIILVHDDEQRRLALETRDREAAETGGVIYTEIVPLSEFTLAEAYHQKYRLRQVPGLEEELQTVFDNDEDLVNSTVAARVNGYLGGFGTAESVEAALDNLGLTLERKERLLDLIGVRTR
jgi:peptide-methionine (S)-S-oxide reductase